MANTETPPNPRVGVAAIVKNRAGLFVVGRRKGAHGAGKWQFPGGHLDFGEDPLACAQRETLEETGMDVRPLGILSVTNDIFSAENKHYITFCVLCICIDDEQQPQVSAQERGCRSTRALMLIETLPNATKMQRTLNPINAKCGTGKTGHS